MRIERRDITPRQAADIFAEAYGDGREVGCYLINPPRFQLKDGVRWYVVELLPGYAGFEVRPEGSP